jgi:pimeloyl-ACP methyl ester carboxylesterase
LWHAKSTSGRYVCRVADWLELEGEDVRLACRDFGGTGRPVLLLHGLAGHSGEWAETAAAMGQGFRILGLISAGTDAANPRLGMSRVAPSWLTSRRWSKNCRLVQLLSSGSRWVETPPSLQPPPSRTSLTHSSSWRPHQTGLLPHCLGISAGGWMAGPSRSLISGLRRDSSLRKASRQMLGLKD